jgi:hypothetical protein
MRTAKVWEFVNAVKAREKVLRMERDDLDWPYKPPLETEQWSIHIYFGCLQPSQFWNHEN